MVRCQQTHHERYAFNGMCLCFNGIDITYCNVEQLTQFKHHILTYFNLQKHIYLRIYDSFRLVYNYNQCWRCFGVCNTSTWVNINQETQLLGPAVD
jgi:hypothetical protein